MTDELEQAGIEVAAGEVVVTINQRDVRLSQEALDVDMESSEQDILNAVNGVVEENLNDADGEVAFTVRKAVNSGTIYVYPKPVAG